MICLPRRINQYVWRFVKLIWSTLIKIFCQYFSATVGVGQKRFSSGAFRAHTKMGKHTSINPIGKNGKTNTHICFGICL